MAGKIFVNYRRDDERSAAARVRDRLAIAFGKSNVFMDVDNLMAGQRFDKELEKALAETDVFLAVMGPRWTDLFKERQASGERDYVREEIAAALKRGIVVIPILIERAALPRGDELPDDLRELVLHQKHTIVHEQFGRDTDALIDAIKFSRRSSSKPVALPKVRASSIGWATAALGVAALAWVAAYTAGVFVPQPRMREPDNTPIPSHRNPLDVGQLPTELASPPSPLKGGSVGQFPSQFAPPPGPPKAIDADQLPPTPPSPSKVAANSAIPQQLQGRPFEPFAALKPGSGQSARDTLAGGKPCPMCPEMVVAPSGSFTMGSSQSEIDALVTEFKGDWYKEEGPSHTVTIAKRFAVGRYAVTFDEWDACVEDGGCRTKPDDQGWGRGLRPVINTSWDDVTKEYLPWLSKKTGKTYRLLSEAEREYVTRAGTTTPFWWGSSISTDKANYDGNRTYAGSPMGEYRQKTLPVASFEANPWGLYQVHGNVREWVEDCWHDSYKGAPTDGSAWTEACTDGSRRVLRGGSWSYSPQRLRSADRDENTSGVRFYLIGFRVARALTP